MRSVNISRKDYWVTMSTAFLIRYIITVVFPGEMRSNALARRFPFPLRTRAKILRGSGLLEHEDAWDVRKKFAVRFRKVLVIRKWINGNRWKFKNFPSTKLVLFESENYTCSWMVKRFFFFNGNFDIDIIVTFMME